MAGGCKKAVATAVQLAALLVLRIVEVQTVAVALIVAGPLVAHT